MGYALILIAMFCIASYAVFLTHLCIFVQTLNNAEKRQKPIKGIKIIYLILQLLLSCALHIVKLGLVFLVLLKLLSIYLDYTDYNPEKARQEYIRQREASVTQTVGDTE